VSAIGRILPVCLCMRYRLFPHTKRSINALPNCRPAVCAPLRWNMDAFLYMLEVGYDCESHNDQQRPRTPLAYVDR